MLEDVVGESVPSEEGTVRARPRVMQPLAAVWRKFVDTSWLFKLAAKIIVPTLSVI